MTFTITIRLLAVETEGAACLGESLKAGERVSHIIFLGQSVRVRIAIILEIIFVIILVIL